MSAQTVAASATDSRAAADARSLARRDSGWTSGPIRSIADSMAELISSTINTINSGVMSAARSAPSSPR